MFDASISLEERIAEMILEYFAYRIQPWEAEELAREIEEEINERLSYAIE